MSFTSPNLSLPYIAPAQAQKHVTHNEALQALDAIVQLSLKSISATTPPSAAQEGDCYYIPSPATDAWINQEADIAVWQDAAWRFYSPQTGWQAWIEDQNEVLIWSGSSWQTSNTYQNLEYLGVHATADNTNRLSVNSSAVLFNNDGNDIRAKLNKNSTADTASFVLQTGFSGRAEIGLAGDDDLSFKVSSDGSSFSTALKISSLDGAVHTNTLKHMQTGKPLSSIMLTLGGGGLTSIYKITQTSTQPGRTVIISSVSSDIITFTSTDSGLFGDADMDDVSYVRIWNTSKTPIQSAWVKTRPTSNQIKITDPSHVSTWSVSETVQIGDPLGHGLSINTVLIAVDISPMLIDLFGQPFRQKGIILTASIFGGGDGDNISVTPKDMSGSGVVTAVHGLNSGTSIIACTELSEISNSNLLGVEETIFATAGARDLNSIAVLV